MELFQREAKRQAKGVAKEGSQRGKPKGLLEDSQRGSHEV